MWHLLAVLVACDQTNPGGPSAEAGQPPSFVSSLPHALSAQAGQASCWAVRKGPTPPGVCLEPVARGFDRPVWAGAVKGGQVWVVEQDGRVRAVGQSAPLLDIEDLVSRKGSEEGLLGLAPHPRFPEDPRVFLYWSAKDPRRSVLAAFRVAQDRIDRASEVRLLEVPQPHGNHNGGNLVFGPDGYLYVGLGDGGSAGDPHGHGQNPNTLLGSMLRLDVDTEAPYAIPPDNPFAQGGKGLPEVWAWGLRNPWRYAFDPVTGWLWAGDVGQNSYEEVTFVRGGGNHGWNMWEGQHCFRGETCSAEGLVPALWEYPRGLGQSVTGGVVYRGRAFPELTSAFIVADFASGRLWALCSDGEKLLGEALLAETDVRIAHIGLTAADEPLVVGYDGTLYRWVPRPAQGCPG